ncbi:isochorismatase family protein [Alienimonas sp. DA493]|uniref:isochorismatase family protein n=1 Tax=Alienimonas sp. DA493 TaxID=3373605 RepID=UPI003754A3CE
MPAERDPADRPELPPEHPALLAPSAGRLIVVDLQAKLLPHIEDGARVAGRATLLIRGARALGVEVRATEQAPDKLGPTVEPVAGALAEASTEPAAKTTFGAAAAVKLTEAISDRRHQAVLCGVETHVCVAQTALELMSAGYAVHVAADACGSRRTRDHEIALARLTAEGATVTSAEAVLFEWCRSAKHPAFAALRDLVKTA